MRIHKSLQTWFYADVEVHKSLLIARLLEHPEELGDYLPDWPGTVAEAIAALESDRREYLDEF